MSNEYLNPRGLGDLITLLKADINKKQNQVQYSSMPDPAQFTTRTVQYTGTSTDNYKKGAFYYSDGTTWSLVNITQAVEIVNTRPFWAAATAGVIYYETSSDSAVTKSTIPGEWLVIKGTDQNALVPITEEEIDDLFDELWPIGG